jgi:hypothetical protein
MSVAVPVLVLMSALFCIFITVPVASPFSAFIPVPLSLSLPLARISLAMPMPLTITFVITLATVALVLSAVTPLLVPVLVSAAGACRIFTNKQFRVKRSQILTRHVTA